MNSSFTSLLRRAGRVATDTLVRALRNQQRQQERGSSAQRQQERGSSAQRQQERGPAPQQSQHSRGRSTHGGTPSPYGSASAREINDDTLPEFDYAPHRDGDADPGEVVWTWVPYEDIPEVGKDRPVLVLAHLGKDVVVLQLTSKDHDHDEEDEARFGRYWFDIGSGDWDNRGRESEVRIDRLLRVGQAAIRREGGVLDRHVFDQVVAAVEDAHRRGL